MTETIGDDLLRGVDEIAAELSKRDHAVTPKQVYRLAKMPGWPIMKIPGIGICARKSSLEKFFEHFEREKAAGGFCTEKNLEDKGRRQPSVGR